MTPYINDQTVQTALHVDTKVGTSISICRNEFNYTMFEKGSQWIYEALVGKGYRFLKFSGDKDGVVPTYGTFGWLNELNLKVSTPWKQYFVTGDDYLAGYVQEYEGLTFATVHGAGHMVPQDQRARAFHLINNWVNQKTI